MKFLDYHLHTKGKYGKEGTEVLAVMWVADEAAGRDPYAADAMHKKAKFAPLQGLPRQEAALG